MASSNSQEFNRFAKRMVVIGGEVEKNILHLKAQIAQRVIEVVARATPADTGLARTSWITTVGSPSRERPEEPAFPGLHLGMSEFLNAQHAIGWAQVALFPESNLKGKNIYIQNNQPYIGQLNRGKSLQQVTPGFVERAVLEGIVIALGAELVPKDVRI